MTWFRFYTEALDDPKVQKLPAEDFRVWVNLLCVAKNNDGQLPSESDCAFLLRMEIEAFHVTFLSLKEAGLIDSERGRDKHTEPHNWKKRQYKSDSSTERVKRYRERERNALVTPRARADTETETDTETENKERKHMPGNKIPGAVVHEIPDQFDRTDFGQWWNHWTIAGTKRGKQAARLKFKTAMKIASLEDLCSGVDRYLAYCRAEGTDVTKIIHPERFLSKGYWENEYPEKSETFAAGNPKEPNPADYGLPDGSKCVGFSARNLVWLLANGERKEVDRWKQGVG